MVLAQLADQFDHRLRLRRELLVAVTWPLIQLALALMVVGFLIWIMGVIESTTGQRVDLLGFGLVGTPGLLIYLALLAGVAGVLTMLWRAALRGAFWIDPIQRLVTRVPGLGPAVEKLALERLTWTMKLTFGVGMEVRAAMRLALDNAWLAPYRDAAGVIDTHLAAGHPVHEALAAAGVFPAGLVDAVAVGEESGRLSETMDTLSRQYQDQARAAMRVINVAVGVAVWAIVAMMIILLIFRLFSFYVGAINSAMP
jgi:type II secretory pathway component PulF